MNWLLLNLLVSSFIINCFLAFYVLPKKYAAIRWLENQIRSMDLYIGDLLDGTGAPKMPPNLSGEKPPKDEPGPAVPPGSIPEGSATDNMKIGGVPTRRGS